MKVPAGIASKINETHKPPPPLPRQGANHRGWGGDNINTVKPMGLVISETDQFLTCSPDGTVYNNSGQKGLIEIKNLLHKQNINSYTSRCNVPVG